MPLLSVVNDRTRRAGASTTSSSAVRYTPGALLGVMDVEYTWRSRSTPSSGTHYVNVVAENGAVQLMTDD